MENDGTKDNLCKLEVIACVLGELSRPGQLLDKGEELVVVASVIVQLNLSHKLNLDAVVLNFAWMVEGQVLFRGLLDFSPVFLCSVTFTLPATLSPS